MFSCGPRWRAVPDTRPATDRPSTDRASIDRASIDRVGVAFARVLRGAGLEVPVGATLDFVRALDCVRFETASGVYWAGRATLLNRPDHIDVYDRAFDAFS